MFAKRLSKLTNRKEWIVLHRLDSAVRSNSSCSGVESTLCKSLCKKNLVVNNSFVKQVHVSSANVHKLQLENAHARSILDSSEIYSQCFATPLPIKRKDFKVDEMRSLMNKQWITLETNEILENFELFCHHAEEFLKFPNSAENMRVITSRLSKFSDNDLQHLMKCLELLNKNVISYKKYRALFDLWSILDSECIKRIPTWSLNEILLMNTLWCNLNCPIYSKFSNTSLSKISRYEMTPVDLVYYAYLLKMNKNEMSLDLSIFERNVEKCINRLSIEELGVISMAFFKCQYQVKSKYVIIRLMQELQNNLNSVSDISLAAILKVLRYSINLQMIEQYNIFQKSLVPRIPKCTVAVLTHMVHMQARTLVHTPELTSLVLERYKNEIKKARLKDIERVLFTLYIFNYDPKTTEFYAAAYDELLSPDRREEIDQHPMSLVYSALFMLQVNYYPENILKIIMEEEFCKKVRKDNIYNLNREYLILDYCIELEHPEYTGPRLRKDIRDFLLTRFGALRKTPIAENQRTNQLSKIMTDVIQTCKKFFGSESVVHIDNLLPHFNKQNIILCYDRQTKKFSSPSKELSKIPTGLIKWAPKDGNEWYVLNIGVHNNMTRNTMEMTGILALEFRHLQQIGYKPILIPYFNWQKLPNNKMKNVYIKQIVSDIKFRHS